MDPHRVVQIKSDLVFEVNLLQRRTDIVHSRRVLLCRAGLDGTEVHPDLLRAAEHFGTLYQDVRALQHIRERNRTIESEVGWERLPNSVDFV